MNQAEALYHLQQIDLSIIQAKKRLQEIAAALGGNPAVQEAQAALSRAETTLSPLRTKARNLELEIQSTAEKAKSSEQHLYSGAIKNPKEMQETQREIDSLKKRHDYLEEQLLEVMAAVEEAEGAVASASAGLGVASSVWEAQNAAFIAEQSEIRAKATDLLEKRKAALQRVEAGSLKLYESMRPRKGNQPVALLQGQSCSACGIEQTLAIVGQVRRGDSLAECLNCGRILTAG